MKRRAFHIWFFGTMLVIISLAVTAEFVGATFSSRGYFYSNFLFGVGLMGQFVPVITYLPYWMIVWFKTPVDQRPSPFNVIPSTIVICLAFNALSLLIVYCFPLYPPGGHPFNGSGNFGGLFPLMMIGFTFVGVLVVTPILAFIMFLFQQIR